MNEDVFKEILAAAKLAEATLMKINVGAEDGDIIHALDVLGKALARVYTLPALPKETR